METPNEQQKDLAYVESFSAWLDHNHDSIQISQEEFLEANRGEEDDDAAHGE